MVDFEPPESINEIYDPFAKFTSPFPLGTV